MNKEKTSYKNCAVPCCTNTTVTTPNKLFLTVPKALKVRKKWLTLARRDNISLTSSSCYFCEDHFDLPNDMTNYMEYKIMGRVNVIKQRPGCLPSKFSCQSDRAKRSASPPKRSYVVKKRKMEVVTAALSAGQTRAPASTPPLAASPTHAPPLSPVSSEAYNDLRNFTATLPMDIGTLDKGVQVSIGSYRRSKGVQTNIKCFDTSTSPMKFAETNKKSVSTSPFKISMVPMPLTTQYFGTGDDEYILSQESQESQESQDSQLREEEKKREKKIIADYNLKKMRANPRLYLGIPLSTFFIVNLIEKNCDIPELHTLLCLNKLRLGKTFAELADDFGLSISGASKIFSKTIPILASHLAHFIVKTDPIAVKKNLPMAFRHRYSSVLCIIDCFEIQIEKPSRPTHQSMTWSEYKKSNTIKYLLSTTPDGLVNYVSPGYGGRTSDTQIVEDSNFLDIFSGCGGSVMADRGFKHVEGILKLRGLKLVRPPSVMSGTVMTKEEARETKQIASLRIHVERVIRRLREFSMLKPHAVVDSDLMRFLDEYVTIACALVNLQDSLIK